MSNHVHLTYEIPGDDFTHAGDASGQVKRALKKIGLDPEIIRNVTIAMYEGEINAVIHAGGGTADVEITPNKITIILKDQGPGIENVELAMQEGFSTAEDNIRTLGFGAGMGLPNIKKYSDTMDIQTQVGVGTTLTLTFCI